MLTEERKQLIHSIAPMYRGLYWGQRVFIPTYSAFSELSYVQSNLQERGYLSLRSVKDLTEEEHGYILENIVQIVLYDYLRSIGIATNYYHPTTGLITVEEFIEAGTLVINPNQPA